MHDDVRNRIAFHRLKWRTMLECYGDHQIPIRLNERFHKKSKKPTMFFTLNGDFNGYTKIQIGSISESLFLEFCQIYYPLIYNFIFVGYSINRLKSASFIQLIYI